MSAARPIPFRLTSAGAQLAAHLRWCGWWERFASEWGLIALAVAVSSGEAICMGAKERAELGDERLVWAVARAAQEDLL